MPRDNHVADGAAEAASSSIEKAHRAFRLWLAGNIAGALFSAKAALNWATDLNKALTLGWLFTTGKSELAYRAYRHAERQQKLTAEQYACRDNTAAAQGNFAQALIERSKPLS